MTCLGCQLTNFLGSERDHYKKKKRHIIATWLRHRRDGWNKNSLLEAIVDYKSRSIRDLATRLDAVRAREIGELGYDKELAERQIPRSQDELQRLSGHCRSPLVSDKDKLRTEWNYSNMSRRRAGGYH